MGPLVKTPVKNGTARDVDIDGMKQKLVSSGYTWNVLFLTESEIFVTENEGLVRIQSEIPIYVLYSQK